MEPLEGRRLLAASPAPVPLGPDFRINTHTAGSQELFPESPTAVAMAADGSFVVAWSSSGQDGSSWGVYAQRYDPAGRTSGGEFLVNQTTGNSQWYPSVASDGDGDFVITWTSYLQDGGQSGVYARRYDASGAALGGEFRVNSTTTGDQRHSAVAVDADGDFVVAWAGYAQSDGAGWDVYAQRYSAAGAKRGGEFRVNAVAAGNQQYASVAAAAGGGFVIAWTTDRVDGSGTAVCARQFDGAGVARGGEFRLNAFAAGDQQYVRVAPQAEGGFVAAWASAGQDGSGRGIYARSYDAAGAPAGPEFRVNETTAGEQFAPTVAADPTGGFVVSWTSASAADVDVYGRSYDAAGAARGGEFRANSTVAGNQAYSSVAADASGRFVVAWEGDAQDGSFFGVYGRRFEPQTVPPAATVVGRHLFYNDSSFDLGTAGPDAADDDAIAADKLALLPGQPSGFANNSSYSRGINGVMVDIASVALPGGAAGAGSVVPTAADFSFRVGRGGDAAGWADAPAPRSVTVRAGGGVLGSDRVMLVWEDGAIVNEWLELTVKATAATGLSAADVFYFGNLIGDTGGATPGAVDRFDVVRTRLAFSAEAAEISSPFDHNRDGRVNLLDVLLIRRNVGQPPLEPVGTLAGAVAPATASEPATSLLAGASDPVPMESDSLSALDSSQLPNA